MNKVGRPYIYTEAVIENIFILMMRVQIGNYKGIYRYLQEHPEELKKCGLSKLPSRRTLSRRVGRFIDKTMAPFFQYTGKEKLIIVGREYKRNKT
jgi:hypothetical protein